jgi:hypothetical protein
MLNDENDCIRYLMKEMDPSEEVLMERAMMEDDDLLIEVESLRQTLKRLDDLPEKNPPAHLTEAILEKASEHAEKRKPSHILSVQPVRYAAAAVLIIGVSVGSLWVYQDSSSKDASRENLQASEMVAPMDMNFLPAQNVSTEPWVDRQNVLYFHDQFNESSTEYDSIMKKSTEKLRPLSSPFYYNTGSRSIQMTGSEVQQ